MMKSPGRILILSFVFIVCRAPSSNATWIEEGVAVCTDSTHQTDPRITTDGAGGAIIAWIDYRNEVSNWDIYTRRIDTNGNPLWATDGVPICMAPERQTEHQIISDGAGGAIITWRDGRSGGDGIYAQRIDANGFVQWEHDGLRISAERGATWTPQLVSDGEGGAIIAWADYRTSFFDIYAQRVDADGDTLWKAGGIAIHPTIGSQQLYPHLIPDGAGGAFIAWQDDRNDPSHDYDIYAQRIDADGNILWDSDVPISTALGSQEYPRTAPDGDNGAIIAWQSEGWGTDIYAQRINANGDTLWTKDGVPVCYAGGFQELPRIIPDGAGGAIIVWTYNLPWSVGDIFAQRIDSNGTALWTANGIPVALESNDQQYPQIAPDGGGGAFITWQDERFHTDAIYAQRIHACGDTLCPANGSPICSISEPQVDPHIVPAEPGCAIITWSDNRNGNYDIHAVRICNCGASPAAALLPDATFTLDQNHPNPFNPVTTISYYLPAAAHVTLDIYDVAGRRIARLVDEAKKSGGYTIEWRGLNDNGDPVGSGTYFYRVRAGKEELSRKMILLR